MRTITTNVVTQPTFAAWFDARHAAAELAMRDGYAVIVGAGPEGWRVIPGEDLETCEDLAGELEIRAEFDDTGAQR